MRYLGIDVHKTKSHVAVLDEDGEVVDEGRVLDATLDEVAEQYAGSKVTIEATSNYYTIYDTLDEYPDMVVADVGVCTKAQAERSSEEIDDKV